MRPYADGLLGRNELKLKLRRKAKRTKLLSAVGAKDTGEGDVEEGIRTGWVCVNVGRVEGGELVKEMETEEAQKGFVGFGKLSGGSSIVVQLMTEEKRGEIDLEKLWTETLNRDLKAKRKLEEDDDSNVDVLGSSNSSNQVAGSVPESSNAQIQQQTPTASSYFPLGGASNPTAGQQIRAYTTSTRHNMATTVETATARSPDLHLMPPISYTTAVETSDPSISKLTNLLSDLKSATPSRAFDMLGEDALMKAVEEFSLAEDRPVESAGTGSVDFLISFYSAMPTFPGPEHWHMHLELLSHARDLGHKDAHTNIFTAQLDNMQIAGLIPEERTFQLVIRALLAPLGKKVAAYDGVAIWPSYYKVVEVFKVMEDMESYGYDPVSPDILTLIYSTCVGSPPVEGRTLQLAELVDGLGAARLRHRLQVKDWTSFWRTWRSYPQRFLPRSAAMYTVFFNAIGDGRMGSVLQMREVLATALLEMEREEPKVVLEDSPALAASVVKAVRFVDPRRKEGEGSQEWTMWWERAMRVLDEG